MALPNILPSSNATSNTQHLAVFGESGSGKTVLLSSFYGHMTEPSTIASSAYRITAKDASQHDSLRQVYLRMRDLNRTPPANRFKKNSFEFEVSVNQPIDPKAKKAPTPKQVSLVWHDYPGEWWEETPGTPEEKQRQKDTVATLMGSDVALLLIDASRLTTDPDTQARYLKSVLGNYRESIRRMRTDLVPDGKLLVDFPRIWVLTLSKADLLPDLTASQFADLVTLHAADEVNQLRLDIGQLVKGGAVALGEDFLRLSSAQFSPDRIDTDTTIGVDTIVPLTLLLPISHFARWEERKILPARKAHQTLVKFTELTSKHKLGPKALAGKAIANPLLRKFPGMKHIDSIAKLAAFLSAAALLGSDQLKRLEENAKAKHEYLQAALLNFEATLAQAEEQGVLVRRRA